MLLSTDSFQPLVEKTNFCCETNQTKPCLLHDIKQPNHYSYLSSTDETYPPPDSLRWSKC